MLSFNIDNGYVDGILRGYKAGLISNTQYHQLIQSETLEDLRLQLMTTDYAPYLKGVGTMSANMLAEQCMQLYVDQFSYLRQNAAGSLEKFMDYLTHGYMIDNVILLISGGVEGREDLEQRCHPLGMFDGIGALSTFSNSSDLYDSILVETPLAPYFGPSLLAQDLDNMHIEIIRNSLYKAYLEQFYGYCRELGGETLEYMRDILVFEADRRAIEITINSFGTGLEKSKRLELYPTIGNLGPEGLLRLSECESMEQLKDALGKYGLYRLFFDSETMDKGHDHRFFEHEMELNKKVFQTQFHYAGFYAFTRFREQELRNIVWIAECISQQQRDKLANYVPIF